MSSWYRSDEQQRGYDAHKEHVSYKSEYDGGYEYHQGWKQSEDDERAERRRQEEREQEEAAEQYRQEQQAREAREERERQEYEYWQQCEQDRAQMEEEEIAAKKRWKEIDAENNAALPKINVDKPANP